MPQNLKHHETLEFCRIKPFVFPTPTIKGVNPNENNNTLTTVDTLIVTLIPSDNTVVNFDYINKAYPKKAGYYQINESVTLKKKLRSTGSYRNLFNVFIDSIHVAELSTDCTTSKNSPYLKYKVINRCFFECDWKAQFKQFKEALNLTELGLTDFHIAHDTHVNLRGLYQHYFLNSTILEETNPYKPAKPVLVDMLWNVNQFVISPARSNYVHYEPAKEKKKKEVAQVRLVIYNKSREAASSGKDYISAEQQKKGMDLNRSIYRAEMRSKKKKLKGIRVEDINQEFIESYFRKHCQNLLSFYDTTQKQILDNGKTYSNSRNSKSRRIDIINLDSLSNKQIVRADTAITDTNFSKVMKTKIEFKQEFYNYIEGADNLDKLRNYITDNSYYLVKEVYSNSPIEEVNRQAFMRYTRNCMDAYDKPPTPDKIARLEAVTDLLFYAPCGGKIKSNTSTETIKPNELEIEISKPQLIDLSDNGAEFFCQTILHTTNINR